MIKYKITYQIRSYPSGTFPAGPIVTKSMAEKWHFLETAKANLKRIKEHFRFVAAYNAARDGSGRDSLLASAKTRDWFIDNTYGVYEESLRLYDNYGHVDEYDTEWFEGQLIRMDIEAEDDEMFFEVDT